MTPRLEALDLRQYTAGVATGRPGRMRT
jgi:hypothetical protein